MLLGVVLLYVGAVLIVNGIWLIGQARVAAAGEAGATAAEAHPTFIQNREVAVLNLFTGFVGVVAAVTLLVQGNAKGISPRSAAGASSCCSPLPISGWRRTTSSNAGGRAFGWYCLFVAITAVPAGFWTFSTARRQRRLDLPRGLLVCLGGAVVPVLRAACARSPDRQVAGAVAVARGHRDRLGVRDPAPGGPARILRHDPTLAPGGWLCHPRAVPTARPIAAAARPAATLATMFAAAWKLARPSRRRSVS